MAALSGLADDKAEAEIGWVIDLVTAIRSVRAEMNITAAIPLVLAGASAESKARAERWAEFIKRLARVSDISSAAAAPKGSVQLVVRGEVAALPLKGVIDLAAERARLTKEMQKADADIARVDAKLGNPNFIARAPEEVVEEEQEKREEALARKAKIAEALDRLKDAAGRLARGPGPIHRCRRARLRDASGRPRCMKIFLAGAGGAIGRRLTPLLRAAGHTVAGTTRSKDKAAAIEALGAEPVVVDVFDAEALARAVKAAAPQVLMHQLTDLPFAPGTPRYDEGLERNARLRIEGTRNLANAAKAAGVWRMIRRALPSFMRRRAARAPRPIRSICRRPAHASARSTAWLRSSRRRSNCRRASCCATATFTVRAPGIRTRNAQNRRCMSMPPRRRRCLR